MAKAKKLICVALTSKCVPCKASASAGSQYCFVHNKAIAMGRDVSVCKKPVNLGRVAAPRAAKPKAPRATRGPRINADPAPVPEVAPAQTDQQRKVLPAFFPPSQTDYDGGLANDATAAELQENLQSYLEHAIRIDRLDPPLRRKMRNFVHKEMSAFNADNIKNALEFYYLMFHMNHDIITARISEFSEELKKENEPGFLGRLFG